VIDPCSCLYHTINILLHRPILCSRSLVSKMETPDMTHLVQCMSSATTILSLFDLYRRTFGDGHVVLSLAYSVYTAASIFLLEIQALKYAAPGTLDKLKYCIFALERVKVANPGKSEPFPFGHLYPFSPQRNANEHGSSVINTGLSLIYQELQKLQIDIHVTVPAPQPQPQPSQSHTNSPNHPHQPHHHHHHHRQQPPSRHASPSQHHPGTPTPAPVAAGAAPPSSVPTLPEYSFQQPLASFELSQGSPMSSLSPDPSQTVPVQMSTHHLGGMPGAVMNPDGTGTYEIAPEVFEAFSYVEPITTNMTPTYDTGWAGGVGPRPS